MSAAIDRRNSLIQRRKGDRLVPLNTEATQIAQRSYTSLRRAIARRELTVVQARPHARIFVWESDLLSWLAGHERRALSGR